MWFRLYNTSLVFFWWFKVIFKVKCQFEGRMNKDMIFQQIKQIVIGLPLVIPCFHVILTGYFNSNIILMIQGHFSCQKANLRVKMAKKWSLANTSRNNCNTSLLCDFDRRIRFWYYCEDSRSFSRSIWRSNLWTHVFHQTQLGGGVIPLFDVILTGEYVYLLTSVIQRHLQDGKSRKCAVTKISKIMFNIGPKGLHVYCISMIVVELITKIIKFYTDLFQKCVFQKMCWPSIFSKGH